MKDGLCSCPLLERTHALGGTFFKSWAAVNPLQVPLHARTSGAPADDGSGALGMSLGQPRISVRTMMGWASEQPWNTVRERLPARVAASPEGQPCRWENFSQLPWETLPWKLPLFDLCLVHGCFLSLGAGPSLVALSVSTADSAPTPTSPSSTSTNEAAHAHTMYRAPANTPRTNHIPFWVNIFSSWLVGAHNTHRNPGFTPTWTSLIFPQAPVCGPGLILLHALPRGCLKKKKKTRTPETTT